MANSEKRKCLFCEKTFHFSPYASSEERGRGKFCSTACYWDSLGRPKVEMTCKCGCGRKYFVAGNRVAAGMGRFASMACRTKYTTEARELKESALRTEAAVSKADRKRAARIRSHKKKETV